MNKSYPLQMFKEVIGPAFMFVDSIIELDLTSGEESIETEYTYDPDAPGKSYLKDHLLVRDPVTKEKKLLEPGVLFLEGIAQTTGLLVIAAMDGLPKGKEPRSYGYGGVVFLKEVTPKMKVRTRAKCLWHKRGLWVFEAEICTESGDPICQQAEPNKRGLLKGTGKPVLYNIAIVSG